MDDLGVFSVFGAFFGALLLRLVCAEVEALLPSVATKLIKRAVARLPARDQPRYREEWFAHLEDCPGKLGKLWHAAGCLYAARLLASGPNKPSQAREGRRLVQGETNLPLGLTARIFDKFVNIPGTILEDAGYAFRIHFRGPPDRERDIGNAFFALCEEILEENDSIIARKGDRCFEIVSVRPKKD